MTPRVHLRPAEPIGGKPTMLMAGAQVEPIYPVYPLGRLMRELRMTLGVTMGQAARAMGVSVAAVSALEHGEWVFLDDARGFGDAVRCLVEAFEEAQRAGQA